MTIKSTIGITSPYGNTNYVLNPSGETTGNFSLQGSATVTRVTTYQKYGLYSYQIAITASGGGINLTLSSLTSAPHYVTFRIRKSEAVRLNVTIGSATKEARLLERIDTTWSLYWAAFSAAEVSGQTNLRITQIGAGANTMYLDGAQVEPNKLTTYIDGTQEGCLWNGAAHGSTSTRSADSRAGGVVKDFWQGYGFVVERVLGAGAVTESLNIDSYAFLPGGELNSSKIQPREFTIIGFFLGDTREDLHAKMQALELELGLDTYPGQQAIRLRYGGARVQKEISARYTEGLEGDLPIFYNDQFSIADEDKWQRNYTFRMKASIQFLATDPFWYEVGESALLLDTNDTATFRIVAGRLRSAGQWSALGPPNAAGTYTEVRAIVEDATYVYLGGTFANFDNIAAADNIVRYNKATGVYSAIDAGLNGTVYTMALAPNGDLYVGGAFTNASGVAAADYLCVLASGASSFTAVGVPNTGAASITNVRSLVIDGSGNLYIGGDFLNWADIAAADSIVMWNGSAYSALSTGLGAGGVQILGLALDKTTIYIGGSFTVGPSYLATWDGTTLAAVDSTIGANVTALTVSQDGILYFHTVDGGNFIYSWNGQAKTLIGTASDFSEDMEIGPDGFLYVSGFSTINGLSLVDQIARFNGYTWAGLDVDLPGTPSILAILPSQYVDPTVPQKYNLFLGFNTSGTGTFAGLETADNDGTISAFPKIVFSRSGGTGATIQTLKNERTGRELLFNYALLDGESLTIDLYPKNRKVISSFFGERMDAILPNSDFSIWQLLPGNNDISAFVTESGSPTVTGYLLWREAFRSWN